jgi:hypothetical protein
VLAAAAPAQVTLDFTISEGGGLNLAVSGDIQLESTVVQSGPVEMADGATVLRVGFWATDALPCAADFNRDGGVDGADVEHFFERWEAGDDSADINQDGGIDGADVQEFFERWEGGC